MGKTNSATIAELLADLHGDVNKEASEYSKESKTEETSDPVATMDNEGKKQSEGVNKSSPATPATAEGAEEETDQDAKPEGSPETLETEEEVDMRKNQISPTKHEDSQEKIASAAKARSEAIRDGLINYIKKQASEQPAKEWSPKEAYEYGMALALSKKAEDVKDLVETGVAPDEETAAAMMEEVAQDNPMSVLPPEVLADEEAAADAATDVLLASMPEEEQEKLDTVAEQLAASGVTEEDLAVSAEILDEMIAEGVPPEKIQEVAAAVAAEDTEKPEEDLEKAASDKYGKLYNLLGELNKFSPEEVRTGVQTFLNGNQ